MGVAVTLPEAAAGDGVAVADETAGVTGAPAPVLNGIVILWIAVHICPDILPVALTVSVWVPGDASR